MTSCSLKTAFTRNCITANLSIALRFRDKYRQLENYVIICVMDLRNAVSTSLRKEGTPMDVYDALVALSALQIIAALVFIALYGIKK